ncbi:LmbE family N-acetylglucosaminyl deacetylase [Algoriphagus aquaeductus]|uniref:LmbE family N-acetylglucosaminyl deacetylase n=1 Tax=Algoriphagus aquaeductus TaxID=475299 RepID=A0A326S0V9_9BACT|nr:PIG-L family deacetylase [Algoriphagus aquaeductus]PZV86479.1 LmbE family N-acetylglucosaminyl deacetylase [Algoriphagus aquaeductus]
MEKVRNLIISPHIDDEVLGAFTFLNETTFVVYLGVENRSYISAEERKIELARVAEKVGFQYAVLDFEVNHYQCADLISPIESYINDLKPEFLLIPSKSYNQDHRAAYEAAHCAARPHDQNFFVKNVLVYEQPQTLLWPVDSFSPVYFKELDLEKKLEAYELYASQVRGHRSPQVLRSMAQIRGKQSNYLYAEGFQILRFC